MMDLLAFRLSVRLGVVGSVWAAATLSVCAGNRGYLPTIGPAPLRYQIVATPVAAPAPAIEESPLPTLPHPVSAETLEQPATPVRPAWSVPDLVRSLVASPFWAALCEGLIVRPTPFTQPDPSASEAPAPIPVVTAEMLVEFFRPGETTAVTNSAVVPMNFTPPGGFPAPSSSATYRSP